MRYNIYVDREELKIYYSDPVTLETIKVISFRTLSDLETYLHK